MEPNTIYAILIFTVLFFQILFDTVFLIKQNKIIKNTLKHIREIGYDESKTVEERIKYLSDENLQNELYNTELNKIKIWSKIGTLSFIVLLILCIAPFTIKVLNSLFDWFVS